MRNQVIETELMPASPAGAMAFEKFDARLVAPFYERSVSDETRRAYRRVGTEFFKFFDGKHPIEITVSDVQRWRDHLTANKKSPATVSFKLSVVRSMFDYLKIAGVIGSNPALTKLVPPPALNESLSGRALTIKEVGYLLSGPDRRQTVGARDYALLLLMLHTSLRVSEISALKHSSIKWSHGRWTLKFKVKGGRERTIPLPQDVKTAVDEYLQLDKSRRQTLKSNNLESHIFQPITNYRTLVFDKPISRMMIFNIVRRWGEYSAVGKLSPHDLRRTAITRALDQGLSYRQVQMMTGHKDPKTVMKYDHGRENLEQNAVNFLSYSE